MGGLTSWDKCANLCISNVKGDKMKKDCTYYWNKVAILIFADLDQEKKLELAGKYLSKDELLHLEELLAS